MKRILLFLIAIFSVQIAQAQVVDISAARQVAQGQVVTVKGIVTNGAELGVIRYMQDATGGIPIYDNSVSPNRGDEIEVTGVMDEFGALLEITGVTSSNVTSTNNALPTPIVVTPGGMNIGNEAQLLKINNVIFTNAGGTFTSGTLNFSDGTQSGQIYLNGSHSLVGTTIPQTAVNLTGLSSQYNGSVQMLLRDANDIEVASSFYVTTNIEQTNLLKTSFDLSFETNINGSSNVEYGLTPAMGTHVSAGGSTTTHTVSLTGLTAGTIYYARVYGFDEEGEAPLKVFPRRDDVSLHVSLESDDLAVEKLRFRIISSYGVGPTSVPGLDDRAVGDAAGNCCSIATMMY